MLKTVLYKKYKPTSPGIRNKFGVSFSYLEKKRFPFLLSSLSRKKFRCSSGSLVNYNRSFGNKKAYRIVDFFREFTDASCHVVGFEYDPNRTSNLALVKYENGTFAYILEIDGLVKGSELNSYSNNTSTLEYNTGDSFFLKDIPLGSVISCLENKPGSGGVFLRSAGNFGTIFKKTNFFVEVQFKSGVVKQFSPFCRATLGKVGSSERKFIRKGKAGVNRWLGRRPSVRGVAKNPVDHPHGGGNGKTSGGRPSVSR